MKLLKKLAAIAALVAIALSPAALCSATPVTYYVSTTGSDSSNGLTTGTAWKTFAKAVSTAACGDTVIVRDGRYGDSQAASGKLSITSKACTAALPLTFRAENSRQAGIYDNGSGYAVKITSSSGIVIDGFLLKSTDNSGQTLGQPIYISLSSYFIVKNNVWVNPNRYANTHCATSYQSQNGLFVDNQCIVGHRHAILMWQSTDIVAMRTYYNPRGGKISGGFSAGGANIGTGDAVVSMYPCTRCLNLNPIADGTTNTAYLGEMNATYGNNVLMANSKILGGISYNQTSLNGAYPNGRTSVDTNHTPQDIEISNNAFVNWGSNATAIRCADCLRALLSNNSVFGATGSTGYGLRAEDTTNAGVTAANMLVTAQNNLVTGMSGTGFSFGASIPFTLDESISNANGTASSPATPNASITNFLTSAPNMGTCKVFVPTGATGKGAGVEGADIGANVLYAYDSTGVLTTTTLWNSTTGAWQFAGSNDLDGYTNVSGQSLSDFNQRVNVQSGGCSLPSGYGTETAPVQTGPFYYGTGTTSVDWTVAIPAGSDYVIVEVGLNTGSVPVGTITGVTGCGGESIPAYANGAVVTDPAWRRGGLYIKAAPTAGTCTFHATTTGTVNGSVAVAYVVDGITAIGTAVTNASATNTPSNSPTVTVTTASGRTVLSFLLTSSTPVVTPCSNQVLEEDVIHPDAAIRIAPMTKAGANGGTSCATLSMSPYWGMTSISLSPISVGGAPTKPTGLNVRRR